MAAIEDETNALGVRLTARGTPDKRELVRAPNRKVLYELLATPQRLEDLLHILNISKRSLYFLLEDLEARGVVVARIGSNRHGERGARWVRLADLPPDEPTK